MKTWMKRLLKKLSIRKLKNYIIEKAREEAEKTETEIDDIGVDILEDLLNIIFGE